LVPVISVQISITSANIVSVDVICNLQNRESTIKWAMNQNILQI
jgi:hypothetical protein